jgi:adenylate cyclase
VNFRWVRLAPPVVTLVCAGAAASLTWFTDAVPMLRNLENRALDWRMRTSGPRPHDHPERLALVTLDDRTLEVLETKMQQSSWPVCRTFYGHVVKELHAQHALCTGFDVFFLSPREDRPDEMLKLAGGALIGGDDYLARVLKVSNNVILGCPSSGTRDSRVRVPFPLLAEAALGLGHCVGEPDSDGVHRRVRPYHEDAGGRRIWALGLVMAATALKLDLDSAKVFKDRIILSGLEGATRTLPLDEQGFILIDWTATQPKTPTVKKSFLNVLGAGSVRSGGRKPENSFEGKLVMVGSTGRRPLLKDEGPTPLGKETPRCLVMLNLAGMMLDDRFIVLSPKWAQALLVMSLALLGAVASWRLRILWSTLAITLLGVGYALLAGWLFDRWRLVLPMVLPLAGALLATHALTSLFRFLLEFVQRGRRGLRSILAPDVIDGMLAQPTAGWKNETRVMSVLFADIRGFSSYSDARQRDMMLAAREQGLREHELEKLHHEASLQTLEVINDYLSAVVEAVRRHGGTIDKYMGDCVMAFWGAPLPDQHHAARAVQAAVEAQCAIAALNERRQAAGDVPLLTMGTGINTGLMTVGFMGSEEHLSNYTVFGHAVNVASRLESLSGSGRILISSDVKAALLRQEHGPLPPLESLGEQSLKGISTPIEVYAVQWQTKVLKDAVCIPG